MRFVADENFPGAALQALREAGRDVMSVAEAYPGISDADVATLCSETGSILLTFDKDFGELVFRRGLAAGSVVVLVRVTPESPEDAAAIVLAAVTTVRDIEGKFCVITRDRIRVRAMRGRTLT